MGKSILLLQSATDEQIVTIQKIAPELEVIKGWESEPDNVNLKDIEIIYGWDPKWGPLVVNTPNSNLKWIQSHTAGIDYMDLATFQSKGISLTTSSGIHAIPIAESVFGMILSYARGIGRSIKAQHNKEWMHKNDIRELNESTIMIVGTGHIGFEVGRLAKAFGMHTIGVNRSGRNVEYMDTVIAQTDITNYIGKADYVVNIMPLTDLTKNFYNKELFSYMKDGTVFINVGRGKSVNEDDLLDALDSGKIAFAGLDVFQKEPLPQESPLWDRDDVLITPHISGLLNHFKSRLFVIFQENLKAFIDGNDLPRNKVDYNRSY